MQIQRLAAFSNGNEGGNPAGVALLDALPPSNEMQQIAARVGYSETAFAEPHDTGFRVRYFSPMSEVPFCGHATIALGAALAQANGNGIFSLKLNDATITVEGEVSSDSMSAALQSPPTFSRSAETDLLDSALTLFGLHRDDLDTRIPPAFAHGGANHFILFLQSRQQLREMAYSLGNGKVWMDQEKLVTVLLGYIESEQRFHTRNAFASGGVFEDPATGAATAALAGYLRDIKWAHGNRIDVVQGEDMGSMSLLQASFTDDPESSIRVSGTVRSI
ncbi:MAG: PhzF family phenazine biosynthesis protein [Granulosicoccus sp.]